MPPTYPSNKIGNMFGMLPGRHGRPPANAQHRAQNKNSRTQGGKEDQQRQPRPQHSYKIQPALEDLDLDENHNSNSPTAISSHSSTNKNSNSNAGNTIDTKAFAFRDHFESIFPSLENLDEPESVEWTQACIDESDTPATGESKSLTREKVVEEFLSVSYGEPKEGEAEEGRDLSNYDEKDQYEQLQSYPLEDNARSAPGHQKSQSGYVLAKRGMGEFAGDVERDPGHDDHDKDDGMARHESKFQGMEDEGEKFQGMKDEHDEHQQRNENQQEDEEGNYQEEEDKAVRLEQAITRSVLGSKLIQLDSALDDGNDYENGSYTEESYSYSDTPYYSTISSDHEQDEYGQEQEQDHADLLEGKVISTIGKNKGLDVLRFDIETFDEVPEWAKHCTENLAIPSNVLNKESSNPVSNLNKQGAWSKADVERLDRESKRKAFTGSSVFKDFMSGDSEIERKLERGTSERSRHLERRSTEEDQHNQHLQHSIDREKEKKKAHNYVHFETKDELASREKQALHDALFPPNPFYKDHGYCEPFEIHGGLRTGPIKIDTDRTWRPLNECMHYFENPPTPKQSLLEQQQQQQPEQPSQERQRNQQQEHYPSLVARDNLPETVHEIHGGLRVGTIKVDAEGPWYPVTDVMHLLTDPKHAKAFEEKKIHKIHKRDLADEDEAEDDSSEKIDQNKEVKDMVHNFWDEDDRNAGGDWGNVINFMGNKVLRDDKRKARKAQKAAMRAERAHLDSFASEAAKAEIAYAKHPELRQLQPTDSLHYDDNLDYDAPYAIPYNGLHDHPYVGPYDSSYAIPYGNSYDGLPDAGPFYSYHDASNDNHYLYDADRLPSKVLDTDFSDGTFGLDSNESNDDEKSSTISESDHDKDLFNADVTSADTGDKSAFANEGTVDSETPYSTFIDTEHAFGDKLTKTHRHVADSENIVTGSQNSSGEWVEMIFSPSSPGKIEIAGWPYMTGYENEKGEWVTSSFPPDIIESKERYESGKVTLDGVERPWTFGFRDATGKWWQAICQPTKPLELPAGNYILEPREPPHKPFVAKVVEMAEEPVATVQEPRKYNRKEVGWYLASENTDAVEDEGYSNSNYANREWSSEDESQQNGQDDEPVTKVDGSVEVNVDQTTDGELQSNQSVVEAVSTTGGNVRKFGGNFNYDRQTEYKPPRSRPTNFIARLQRRDLAEASVTDSDSDGASWNLHKKVIAEKNGDLHTIADSGNSLTVPTGTATLANNHRFSSNPDGLPFSVPKLKFGDRKGRRGRKEKAAGFIERMLEQEGELMPKSSGDSSAELTVEEIVPYTDKNYIIEENITIVPEHAPAPAPVPVQRKVGRPAPINNKALPFQQLKGIPQARRHQQHQQHQQQRKSPQHNAPPFALKGSLKPQSQPQQVAIAPVDAQNQSFGTVDANVQESSQHETIASGVTPAKPTAVPAVQRQVMVAPRRPEKVTNINAEGVAFNPMVDTNVNLKLKLGANERGQGRRYHYKNGDLMAGDGVSDNPKPAPSAFIAVVEEKEPQYAEHKQDHIIEVAGQYIVVGTDPAEEKGIQSVQESVAEQQSENHNEQTAEQLSVPQREEPLQASIEVSFAETEIKVDSVEETKEEYLQEKPAEETSKVIEEMSIEISEASESAQGPEFNIEVSPLHGGVIQTDSVADILDANPTRYVANAQKEDNTTEAIENIPNYELATTFTSVISSNEVIPDEAFTAITSTIEVTGPTAPADIYEELSCRWIPAICGEAIKIGEQSIENLRSAVETIEALMETYHGGIIAQFSVEVSHITYYIEREVGNISTQIVRKLADLVDQADRGILTAVSELEFGTEQATLALQYEGFKIANGLQEIEDYATQKLDALVKEGIVHDYINSQESESKKATTLSALNGIIGQLEFTTVELLEVVLDELPGQLYPIIEQIQKYGAQRFTGSDACLPLPLPQFARVPVPAHKVSGKSEEEVDAAQVQWNRLQYHTWLVGESGPISDEFNPETFMEVLQAGLHQQAEHPNFFHTPVIFEANSTSYIPKEQVTIDTQTTVIVPDGETVVETTVVEEAKPGQTSTLFDTISSPIDPDSEAGHVEMHSTVTVSESNPREVEDSKEALVTGSSSSVSNSVSASLGHAKRSLAKRRLPNIDPHSNDDWVKLDRVTMKKPEDVSSSLRSSLSKAVSKTHTKDSSKDVEPVDSVAEEIVEVEEVDEVPYRPVIKNSEAPGGFWEKYLGQKHKLGGHYTTDDGSHVPIVSSYSSSSTSDAEEVIVEEFNTHPQIQYMVKRDVAAPITNVTVPVIIAQTQYPTNCPRHTHIGTVLGVVLLIGFLTVLATLCVIIPVKKVRAKRQAELEVTKAAVGKTGASNPNSAHKNCKKNPFGDHPPTWI